MSDITLRFHKDMLVLSAPLDAALARQGIDAASDWEYVNLVEPEAVRDALRLESLAGAQCLVTNTKGITPARLAHQGMEARLDVLAHAALQVMRPLKPQHIMVDIGPCGLPLDGTSASSLNENRDQYARVARAFSQEGFDAFFLDDFARAVDLKCALMGIGQASDRPVFATIKVDADGLLADGHTPLEEAVALMEEYGASVAGFITDAPPQQAAALAVRACAAGFLPVLAALSVAAHAPKQGEPTLANPYYCPDTMVSAAACLRRAGAQFLRATGQATPAYTGALAVATDGFDVARCIEGV